MKRVVFMVLFAFVIGLCSACNAVTPGPSTTRSSAAVVTMPATAEEETTAAAVKETTAEETEEETTAAAETTAAVEGHKMYTTAGINVRDGASTDSEIVGTLEEGEEVLVVGEEGNWAIIRFEGENRYVSYRYLSDSPEE